MFLPLDCEYTHSGDNDADMLVWSSVCSAVGEAEGEMLTTSLLRCRARPVVCLSPPRVDSYLHHLGVIDSLLRVRLQRSEIVSALRRELPAL